MQLEPGPIPALDASWYPASEPPPGFADLVTTELNDLVLLETEMQAVIALGDVPPDAPPDDGLGGILDWADQWLVNYDFSLPSELSLVDNEIPPVNEAMQNAYDAIPAEAWSPVPAPEAIAGAPPVPATYLQGSGFSISNLTRPGASDFQSGDTWQIRVNIPPISSGAPAGGNYPIYLNQEQSNQWLSLLYLGNTDQYGVLVCQGTFGDSDVGPWTLIALWLDAAGDYLPIGNVNFLVLPAGATTGAGAAGAGYSLSSGLQPTCTIGAQVAGAAIRVTLSNTTNIGFNNFFEHDTWHLEVDGPPNSPVFIWATQDGNPWPVTQLGVTDANGVFLLDGQMSAEYVGTWVEYYQVGDTQWSGTLNFTVSITQPTS